MKRVRVRAKKKRTPITAKDVAIILIGAVIDILVGLLLILADRLI